MNLAFLREKMKKLAITKCFSFTASGDRLYRYFFTYSGLKSTATDLGDGTIMECWVPKAPKQSKPNLLLLHGFGANAMWQYGDLLRHFTPKFNVYIPDLLFFGGSYSTRPERSETFQAQCVMWLMERFSVTRMSVVGISYGGFVAYNLMAMFPEAVERLVVCSAGVCLEEKDMRDGLFKVSNLEEAIEILLPQTPEKLRELIRFSFVKPAVKGVPSCFLSDFIDVMCTDFIDEKRELIQSILKDRKLSDLPRIKHTTLIIWGEQDQIFPLELGLRLRRYIGENSRLVVIRNAGHAVNLEKAKEFSKHLKEFLLIDDSTQSSSSSPPPSSNKID